MMTSNASSRGGAAGADTCSRPANMDYEVNKQNNKNNIFWACLEFWRLRMSTLLSLGCGCRCRWHRRHCLPDSDEAADLGQNLYRLQCWRRRLCGAGRGAHQRTHVRKLPLRSRAKSVQDGTHAHGTGYLSTVCTQGKLVHPNALARRRGHGLVGPHPRHPPWTYSSSSSSSFMDLFSILLINILHGPIPHPPHPLP